jgi:hypothetical protein
MDNSLKSKLTGWSATVGLVALSLLGNTSGPADAAVPAPQIANPPAAQGEQGVIGSATGATGSATYRIAGSPPPPPPPPSRTRSPPAVGAVRG